MSEFTNHDMAVIAAAQLAFDHAWRNAMASNATPRSISASLVPLFGINWTKKVISAVKTKPINDLLAKIRNVDIPREDYNRLADLFKLAFFAPRSLPPRMGGMESYSRKISPGTSALVAGISLGGATVHLGGGYLAFRAGRAGSLGGRIDGDVFRP